LRRGAAGRCHMEADETTRPRKSRKGLPDVSAMTLDDVTAIVESWLRRPRNLGNYPHAAPGDSHAVAETVRAMLRAFERSRSVEESDLAAARLAVLYGSTGTPVSRELLAQEIAFLMASARSPG